MLSADALEAPVRTHAKTTRKTEHAEPAHKTAALDLFDSRSGGGEARHPAAYLPKEPARQAKDTDSYHKEPQAAVRPEPAAKAKKPRHTGPAKLFVLDTNVLMHDPMCLFRFEEHDIFLPIMTLEELDNNKKGMSEIARNARQTSRMLDELLAENGDDIDEGIDLYGPSSKLASGRLFLQTEAISSELPQGLPTSKVDNQILSV
ncbi:MAG: PIN domain-containing protein, partial [Polaromonas sp.]|nr:PIN domain-containing protein [Polaromonas sp.]